MSTEQQVFDIIAYRRLLTGRDENLKAYHFINAASKLIDSPELKAEAQLVFKQMAHLLDPGLYSRYYSETNVELPIDIQYVFKDFAFPDRLRWVKRQLKEQGAKSVLDLGCSEGSYALNIANEGYDVTGVNLFTKSIATATERAKELNLEDRARFVQADLMGYDEGTKFDAVMLFEVIEHVPDPRAVVEKMMSLTNPEGVCYISTPNETADFRASMLGADQEDAAHFEFKGHVRVFTEETLRELVKDYEVTNFYHSETDNMPLLHIAFRRKK